MNNEKLENLSDKELKKKETNTKTLIGLFIPIILGLLYFGFREYQNGEVDMPISIIAICSIGGLVSLLPNLKSIQEELKRKVFTSFAQASIFTLSFTSRSLWNPFLVTVQVSP